MSMGLHTQRAAAAAMLACAMSGTVLGQAALPADINDLLERIKKLEQDNVRQREEIDELRAAQGENWLTEQRAVEIRALVAETIADADTRASLLQNGMTAGWADGFFLASADNRFKLQVNGQIQFRWVYNFAEEPDGTGDQHRRGFELTRTRLTFRGHVFSPDLTYLVRGGFSRDQSALNTVFPLHDHEVRGGTFQLYDAWVRWNLNNEMSFRIGQFKLPFAREELVSSRYQLAAERSLINEHLSLGRSQGIELQYLDDVRRVALAFSEGGDDDFFGIVNIAGINPIDPANSAALRRGAEYAATVRGERLLAGTWEQFEDFTSRPGEGVGVLLGGAVHVQQGEYGAISTIPALDVSGEDFWFAATGDLSMEWGGANLFLGVTYHYIDFSTPPGGFDAIAELFGVVLQGGLYVTPKVEVFGRFECGITNIKSALSTAAAQALDAPDLFLATVGVNYYIDGHDVKWTTDLGVNFSEVDPNWAIGGDNAFSFNITGWRASGGQHDTQVVFRSQIQLLF